MDFRIAETFVVRWRGETPNRLGDRVAIGTMHPGMRRLHPRARPVAGQRREAGV